MIRYRAGLSFFGFFVIVLLSCLAFSSVPTPELVMVFCLGMTIRSSTVLLCRLRMLSFREEVLCFRYCDCSLMRSRNSRLAKSDRLEEIQMSLLEASIAELLDSRDYLMSPRRLPLWIENPERHFCRPPSS